jgi:hypothetical protein
MSTSTKLYRRDAFKYTPAAETDILATWRRFGFRPTTYTQRRARQGGVAIPAPAECAAADARRPALRLAATKK